jgi:transposase-like protein DUF772
MKRGNFAMRPRERRETSERDLFRSRLDQIIDMKHALVKLGRAIDWGFLEQTFGAVYTDKPGQPPLPTQLMAGLAILKHTYDLSDEALCDRWVENRPWCERRARGRRRQRFLVAGRRIVSSVRARGYLVAIGLSDEASPVDLVRGRSPALVRTDETIALARRSRHNRLASR